MSKGQNPGSGQHGSQGQIPTVRGGGEGGTGRQMSKAKSFLVVCILLSSIWVLRFGKKI